MLAFSFHMMIADLKRSLGGWKMIFAFLFMLLAVILSFVPDSNTFSLGYFIVIMISLFRPAFTKIYHVVPLTIKDIHKIVWWRIFLFSSILTILYILVYFFAIQMNYELNKYVVYYPLFYICTNVFISISSLTSFKENQKKSTPGYVWMIIICSITMFALMLYAFGILDLVHNAEIRIALSILPVAVAFLTAWVYMRNLTFADYVYVPSGIWDKKKKEEQ